MLRVAGEYTEDIHYKSDSNPGSSEQIKQHKTLADDDMIIDDQDRTNKAKGDYEMHSQESKEEEHKTIGDVISDLQIAPKLSIQKSPDINGTPSQWQNIMEESKKDQTQKRLDKAKE